MDQATDEARRDPELSDAARRHASTQLDGLVQRIREVLATEGRPDRPGPARSDGGDPDPDEPERPGGADPAGADPAGGGPGSGGPERLGGDE
ncbi:MAG: hypothetical protein AAF962_01990 [Actinomycetota bacterium]